MPAVGTSRTSRDVRLESAKWTKADNDQEGTKKSGPTVIDPPRVLAVSLCRHRRGLTVAILFGLDLRLELGRSLGFACDLRFRSGLDTFASPRGAPSSKRRWLELELQPQGVS